MNNKSLIVMFLITTIVNLCFGQKEKFNFEYNKIGQHVSNTGQTALVDVDNDGDLDWVFGQRGDMYWYE